MSDYAVKKIDKMIRQRTDKNKKSTLPKKVLTWGIVLALGTGLAVYKEFMDDQQMKEG